ncbi:MAG: VWA domain-containing protein [Verrucomicrobia bacterium]|nr:VWA domain-containing protein [Verrucomicrobiota bacterium]
MKNLSSLLVLFVIANCLIFNAIFAQDSEFSELDAEFASQTGTAYTIIFDDSGSMEGGKLSQAKQAFRWWLEKAEPNNAWCFLPMNRRSLDVEFVKNGESQVLKAVDKLRVGGMTPIVATLERAFKMINKRRETVTPYERHLLILLTDGHETKHPGGNPAVCEMVSKLRMEGVEVFGIGFHGQGDYLDGFATHFVAANNREELQRSLANVDAEVPLDIEFRISAEEEKAMARVSALPLGKEVRTSHDGAEGEEGYCSIPEAEVSQVGIVLVVVVGIFVLVFVAKRAVSP